MEQKIMRIGILGTLRGGGYANLFNDLPGSKVTAVCDNNPRSLEGIRDLLDANPDIAVYDNFDEFIESGRMDAVMLCNYFCEHVPFAVKAMERGIHVLSECTPALTMAECVELCRTVEKTGCKYMLAENYPFFACNMEMKRRFETGNFGKALYCEGEYNHPVTPHDKNMLAPGRLHWRNWLPRSYYLTHALAPILYITGNSLKAVNCKCVFAPDTLRGTACQVGDMAAIMLCEMEDGSLARVTGCAAWGGHGNWYRICGEKGSMENIRGTLEEVRVQYNPWNVPEGETEVAIHPARWYEDEEMNKMPGDAGHGGGDFWVAYHFMKYVTEGVEPFFNVYRSVSMSATAVLALRSSQEGGKEYKIPDFTSEEERKIWENDTESPFPDENGNATMPCCSHPDFSPGEEDYRNAEKDWQEAGLITE
ncbi:MAG: Gfo/Idh/MocA family oxidoreductase [Ruminococcaceae bacterium]|nr:Gfo/Idh/MocA family oxidoreductase [Oscillospiraceae bacterium]